MKFEFVDCEIEKSFAIITIHNPPVNALGSEINCELYERLHRIDLDENIKVIILTSKGEKFFAAGADIKEFLSLNGNTGPIYSSRNNYIREYIRTFPKPIICAVNGVTIGAGIVLALLCDIRIAVKHATFSMGEINMGIIGGTQPVARMLHSGIARKMIYSGLPIDSFEAYTAGLIDEVVDKINLLPRAIELAKVIAEKPPLALRFTKECMLKAYDSEINISNKYEYECLRKLWKSADRTEALCAFTEKRKAHFEGN